MPTLKYAIFGIYSFTGLISLIKVIRGGGDGWMGATVGWAMATSSQLLYILATE